ncbi:MAG: hypothetical protein CK548_03785 [Opitutia bacterium]|nr:MAG: hypothetical protein CK548_03785 [Opitutae bacterium]
MEGEALEYETQADEQQERAPAEAREVANEADMMKDSEMRRIARAVGPGAREGAVAMWSDLVASARAGAQGIALPLADEVS